MNCMYKNNNENVERTRFSRFSVCHLCRHEKAKRCVIQMLHETKNKLKRKITTNRNTNPISYHFSSFIFFFFCCFLLTTKSVIFFILMLLLWICVMLIFAPTSVLSAFSFLQNGQTKQNEKKNENITATCILFDLSSRVTPCAIC